jgi:RNA ligase
MSPHPLQHIVDLLRTQELAARYAGLIDVKTHADGGLVLLNYTEECQFQGAWDDVTRHCRGLVIDTQRWEVAALPFQKFFNLNERPESSLEALPGEAFAVYEKLDGSLGITYRRPNGQMALATRGAFDSEQAIKGTALLHLQIQSERIPEHLTCLFEIVLQGVSCVPLYDFEGLVLLSAFDRLTGRELDWSAVALLAEDLGCKTAAIYPFATLEDVISSRATLPPTFEGYVLRFESGQRVKVKGDAYLAFGKLAMGLTKNRILLALADGTIDNFRREVPEEFLNDVDASIQEFYLEAAQVEAEVVRYLAAAPSGCDRKTFALWVKENVPEELQPVLFRKFGNSTINWFRHLQISKQGEVRA